MSVRVYVCHHCHGRSEGEDGTGRPWGWYALTVNVPREMGKKGQPFMWVGLWCSAACLAADMPELEDQERLARLAYEADIPDYGTDATGA
jgi:hypothetical protein